MTTTPYLEPVYELSAVLPGAALVVLRENTVPITIGAESL